MTPPVLLDVRTSMALLLVLLVAVLNAVVQTVLMNARPLVKNPGV